MRLVFITLIAGVSAVALPASPGPDVASIGQCPKDCWNESAAQAGCDPNTDDDCLCGIFFDLVTTCVSETCSIPDNLAALDFLDGACS
ncbi:hypothetical protein K505DRAFT_366876 [Melanomma pulvis-pyrius CBS 109.77]|uniref:CFEM domain-containing protein n=1 Tax=Melanomma pulvis-pyrius CBS 109.77 TaxID=1314802 RepID=A0A6A6WVN0_9PLEO|nr:hypothetical protein K505DRAFT_366876 [Melanomma pulvis-pyrius CBS 109.77]